MPGNTKEVRLDTVINQNKYPNGTLLRRYGKIYRVTRTIQELHNGRPTGYFTVLGTEVRAQ